MAHLSRNAGGCWRWEGPLSKVTICFTYENVVRERRHFKTVEQETAVSLYTFVFDVFLLSKTSGNLRWSPVNTAGRDGGRIESCVIRHTSYVVANAKNVWTQRPATLIE